MDPIWEDIFRAQEWGRYPDTHVVRFVARAFYGAPDRRAVRILDLGSGPGAVTWYLVREGFSVAAIDGSTEAITRLGSRLASEGVALPDARVGDVTSHLPWPDATFHAVVDNGCLCCNPAPDFKRGVGEVARVLRPGGLLYSVTFDPQTSGYGTGRQVGPLCYRDMPTGALANRGLHQFTDRALLPWLYEGLDPVAHDYLEWTVGQARIAQHLTTWRRPIAQEVAA